MIATVPAGAALRVFLAPPAGAVAWRVLRKDADTFTGPNDPDARIAFAGADRTFLDDAALIDGTAVWYRAYYWDGAAWAASTSRSATPQSTYSDASVDALTVVRDRLDAGMVTELQRNAVRHPDGMVPVLTAPPVFDDVRFPVLTVHLQNEQPAERFIGEDVTSDTADIDPFDGSVSDTEGWLASTTLVVMGWTMNPDERVALRKAIRRVLIANLPVFDEHGLLNVDFSMQDTEDFTSYSAPVYQTMTTITCKVPVGVTSADGSVITDVLQTITT